MIRYARTSDHPAIAHLLTEAFGRPDEARLVDALRSAGDMLFERVAEADEAIVGYILFSRLYADRAELIAALAPMAILPDRQRTGLGSALIRSALEIAPEYGVVGVLVLGDPAYYGRFGFSPATTVRAPYAGHPAFQSLALEPGAFDHPMTVAYPDAFGG